MSGATLAGRVTLGAEPHGTWATLGLRLHELFFGLVLYEFWRELERQRRRYADAMNSSSSGSSSGSRS